MSLSEDTPIDGVVNGSIVKSVAMLTPKNAIVGSFSMYGPGSPILSPKTKFSPRLNTSGTIITSLKHVYDSMKHLGQL